MPTVGVGVRGIEFLLDFLLELGVDVMFETRGGGVEVVFGELKVLLEIGLPEAVGADDGLGAAAAFLSEGDPSGGRGLDESAGAEPAESEPGHPAVAEEIAAGVGIELAGASGFAGEFLGSEEAADDIFGQDTEGEAELMESPGDQAVVRSEDDGEGELETCHDGHHAGDAGVPQTGSPISKDG